MTAVAKKELMYAMPFGLAAYLAGVVFIDRKNTKSAYSQLKVTSDVMVHQKVFTVILLLLFTKNVIAIFLRKIKIN